MNTHEGHQASCLCCEHLDFQTGWAGCESDPGESGELRCRKGLFDLIERFGSHPNPGKFIHDEGRDCPDFSPKPTPTSSA